MFTQSQAIRDYVFPLAAVIQQADALQFKQFLGTAFLIGDHGFALTAAHVAASFRDDSIVAMFADDAAGWRCFRVLESERHPSEDVAVLKIEGASWKSFFRLSNSWEGASLSYRMFGYPEDAAYELVSNGRAQGRPDMIYCAGYVRRRTNHPIPALIGRSFFELSEIAGTGCSGSPIFKFTQPVWDVVGVYVGEKLNDRGTNVAYAVREEAFRDWVPKILETSVLHESQLVTLPKL